MSYEQTTTERVMASSEFDDETKIDLLRALMGSECPGCAEEAHQALHDIAEGNTNPHSIC